MRLRAVVNSEGLTDQEYSETRGLRDWTISQIIEAQGENPLDAMQEGFMAPRNLLAEDATKRIDAPAQ